MSAPITKESEHRRSRNDGDHTMLVPRDVQQVAVFGAGTMGHGIAQVFATAGHDVVLHDINAEQLKRAAHNIERNIAKGIERGKLASGAVESILPRINFTNDFATALGAVDLYIEAAPEVLEVKQEILRRVEAANAATDRPYIFATNTSSLSITQLAQAGQRPELIIGMHFFNPVHLMRLVEIVVGRKTAHEVTQVVRRVVERIKKEPITVNDAPGFASSRLGVALGLEAMRMLEQGVASAEDIDAAMTLGYNHPTGPLRLTDLIGLDVRLHIAEYLHAQLRSEVFRPPDILRRMVREGRLGQKSGEGFYKWTEE